MIILWKGRGRIVIWKALLKQGEEILVQAGIADAELDAWYLLEYVSGMSRAAFFLHGEEEAAESQENAYLTLIRRRKEHIPLQHLTGTQEFMGMEFMVSKDVLVPRQDTELLVENLLPFVQDRQVLDLCTGSGCIGISLAKLGNPKSVDAVDLSKDALAVARENARNLQAEICFIESDLFTAVMKQYDVIVSNPPYIASDVIDTLMPEVKEHEPMMALDGGADGLDFYRRIAKEALIHLKSEGMLWLEIGYDQGETVSEILRQQGYEQVACLKDLCGLDRVIRAVRPR